MEPIVNGTLFDLGERTQLELTGGDRAKFLHGFCTNDIKSLSPGQGCEAFVCNLQGKVLGHIAVFCTEQSLWISGVPGQEETLFAHLDRYLINEDVQIHRRTAERGELYLQGSALETALEHVGGASAEALIGQPLMSHATLMRDGAEISFRLVDWLGEPGFLISAPRTSLTKLLNDWTAAGGEVADVDRWNALRIEAGFPYYGIDITTENLAQEAARTERCISFRKGCYLGQEPIARIDALGHVNRELKRLVWEGDEAPESGVALLDSQTKTPVGTITSAAPSARTARKIVALGYVRSKLISAAAPLVIQLPSRSVDVNVV